MLLVSPRRSRIRTLLFWAAPVTWLGCGGGGGTDVALPSLTVSTSTEGIELDPDGYSLLIDGSQNQSIGVSATMVIERLSEGQHTVGLTGLAANCSAQGENPRTITVRSGATTNVAFAVGCSATSGTLEVAVATAGPGTDPDGFALLLDGSDRGAIAPNAPIVISGLGPGSHTVGLTGLAANCQVTGENPRGVNVAAGQSTPVEFQVTCAAPAPSTGTLEVVTATTGVDLDPDGYAVSVSGGASQPVGLNGSLSLPNLAAARHTVGLTGLAANCAVAGENPRPATVPAGGTVRVTFAITCAAPPPGAGSVQVTATTSGSSLDPDGYSVSVGSGSQTLPSNGSVTIGSLTAGSHSVGLSGVASNCTVGGANPRTVTVTAGQTATIAFAITCSATGPTTGNLRISAATSGPSPDSDGYTVTVDGDTPQSIASDGNRTVDGLSSGNHSVALGEVAANCTVAGDNPRSVSVTAGQTTRVDFSISCVSTGPSINLRIERMYITQSSQTPSGNVPLVQGRDGFLRVFVTASGPNSVSPAVRAQFYHNGSSTPAGTLTIPATNGSTPTSPQEGSMVSSWNIRVPGTLIQSNTRILVDVDPTNAIAETNESDNTSTASGAPEQLTVRVVPPVRIRFVSVRQGAGQQPGNVSNGNKDQLVDQVRRLYPLNAVETEVRSAVYTASAPLEAGGGGWNQVLSEIEALRVAEAPDRTFYGVVKLDYNFGVVGNGFIGLPSAIGTDAPDDVRRVLAHELGHTWGRWHSPCGSPGGLDPSEPYPYPNGQIGVFGLDIVSARLRPPTDPDIMGYCPEPWISDYTYRKVLEFRGSSSSMTATSGQVQPSVLVWGHIVNGRAVLEPAFQIAARPTLPARSGPYSLDGTALDGSRLFALSFDAAPSGDAEGSRHFAFVIPLDQARAARLASLRLSGPGILATAMSQSLARQGTGTPAVVARREAGTVKLEWNSAAHPVVMVRDPVTGEVLSFARGGSAQVWTARSELDVDVSDGVKSQRIRLAIRRP